jgi:hypothetical protein
VDAAVAAQRALELPVRIGIATGKAEFREGDYFGVVLNRVARVMAAGHGGQILLAESAAGLLSGVDLLDLGTHELRDLPRPKRVVQLYHPDLRNDFPPLRTPKSIGAHNLPVQLTSFVAREAEMHDVRQLLAHNRLVRLTGAGGAGKTRLAVEIAARIAPEYADGVWYADLAPVPSAAAANANDPLVGGRRSPPPSATWCGWSARDSAIRTSPHGFSSPRAPCKPTSPTSTPNSGSAPAYSSPKKQPATPERARMPFPLKAHLAQLICNCLAIF